MDPRAARTRLRLQDSLLELARERPLDDITVGDIAERADVNRSSFYQHYSDKETLLADALEAAVDEVVANLEPAQRAPRDMPAELQVYLAHIAANAALYRRILGDHGSAVVANRLRARFQSTAVDALSKVDNSPFDGLPLDVAAAGIAGCALGVITAWVSRDPLPPVDTAAVWVWRVLVWGTDAERAAV